MGRFPRILAVVTALLPCSVAQSSTASTTTTSATSCPKVLTPSYDAPVMGSGWTAQLIAQGLQSPRSLVFDTNGALIVVQKGAGLLHMTFDDLGGTCLVVNQTKTLVDNSDLNHAVQLSADGATLYASTSTDVYRWSYNASEATVGDNQTLVTNMSNTDHVSRTLLLSRKANGTLIVSRGSSENMDMAAQQLNSGHSQIRAFDIVNPPAGRPYDYPSEGTLLGWGLRNSVGVAEHPVTGGIFSVENSADQVERNGTDIHQDNPGEEMNYHGFLNGSKENQGGNYGYPDCFALWGTDIPNKGNLTVGSQFALDPSATLNDTTCARDFVPPRLTFQAHTAPLDMLFSSDGTAAYVTFHGSWDRAGAVGYRLSAVPFAAGQPAAPPDSADTAAHDILSNADLSRCPDGCFRPAGLAWDARGRLFMNSDTTGDIYVLQQAEVSAGGTGGTPASSSSSSAAGTLVTPTAKPNLAPRSTRSRPGGEALCLTFLAVALSLSGLCFTMA